MNTVEKKNHIYLFNKYLKKTHNLFTKNKLYYLITIIHYLVAVYLYSYPILIWIYNYKGKYNYGYLLFLFVLLIHWIILNNECILSVFIKKKINPNYKNGSLIYGCFDLQVAFKKKNYDKNDINMNFFYVKKLIFFTLVLLKTKLSVKIKIFSLLLFMILIIKNYNLYIIQLEDYKVNLKDRNNEIFKF